MSFSVVNYYGKQSSRCGYCKGAKCSIAHGMHAYTMCPQDYQDLIDRGWRRSGHYCYKPHNPSTCCPCYTIKCDALEFKLSKSHKKILKRMSRFLRDGKKDKNDEVKAINAPHSGTAIDDDHSVGCASGSIRDEPQGPNLPIPDINLEQVAAANPERQAAASRDNKNFDDKLSARKSEQTQIEKGVLANTLVQPSTSSMKSCDDINPTCKKAKQIRLERRQAKLEARGMNVAAAASKSKTSVNQEKTLADYFAEASSADKHKLQVVLVQSNKQRVTDEAFHLYRKYQLIVHNDNPSRLTPTSLQRFCYKSPLQLKLVHVKSQQFKITQSATYALYQKYQTRIHNCPPENVEEYLEFLQRSPLKHSKNVDGPGDGYGSFHQQYWLDDKLIAVAVIDILPNCVSSVYFFYDPDYSFLSLGTYGSLREIEFVQRLAQTVPALKYYYMGYYIHSCTKMRYKGKLVPSQLLCPETYTWHLLTDEICSKLDANKYQRFNTDPNAGDAVEFSDSDVDKVLLLIENNTCVPYRQYIRITGEDDDREMIIEWGKLVGKGCAHRMLYLKM